MHPREFLNNALVAASSAEASGFTGLAEACVEIAVSAHFDEVRTSNSVTQKVDEVSESDDLWKWEQKHACRA